jgi:hypothetical protein
MQADKNVQPAAHIDPCICKNFFVGCGASPHRNEKKSTMQVLF